MPLLPGSIGETFVMLMANCITSFSLGEALEMAWKVIFKPLFNFFQQFFFINLGRPLSISGSRPSQRPSSRANVLTISGDEFPQASGASKNRKIKKAYKIFSKVILEVVFSPSPWADPPTPQPPHRDWDNLQPGGTIYNWL